MKEFLHKNKYIIITFLIVLLLLLIISISQGLYPFGDNLVYMCDLEHQYNAFLSELSFRLTNSRSLIYSFNISQGIPFYRTIINYLCSPINLIVLLLKDNIPLTIYIIIMTKILFSSVSMSIYLKNTIKNNISIIPFSLLYTFSGYIVAYFFNIMWLDAFMLLPLICLGINKLIDNKSPYLYIITLALTLLSNYYIGYMICIYVVLYFLTYFFLKIKITKKEIISKFSLFAFSSIIGGTLVFFALYPMLVSLNNISALDSSLPYELFYINPLNFLFAHLPSNEMILKVAQETPVPNISCGLLTIIMIVYLFFNKKINKKIKYVTLSIIIFFFLSFSFSYLDYIWNVFRLPNDLPWRYSFLYIFTIITIATYSFNKINIKDKSLYKSILIVAILPLLALITRYSNLEIDKIIIILILLSVYYVLFKTNKLKELLIIIVCIESIFNINTNWLFSSSYEGEKKTLNETKEIVSEIKDINDYKTETLGQIKANIGSRIDINNISGFSSVNYSNISLFQHKIGIKSNKKTQHMLIYPNTPIYNSLFNLKYIILNNDQKIYLNKEYYKKIKEENLIVYEYLYPTSLMYALNENIKTLKLSEDVFDNQNIIVNKISEINNIITDLKVNKTNSYNVFEIKNKKNKDIYIYFEAPSLQKSYTLYINDEEYSVINPFNIINIGKYKDDVIKVKIEPSEKINDEILLEAAILSDKKFNEFYKILTKDLVNITKNDEDYIEANINLNEDKTIISSIPYDNSWVVKVDNKEVETFSIDNTYLAFDIESGTHNITLEYKIKGIKEGIIISIISLISLIIYSIIKRYR